MVNFNFMFVVAIVLTRAVVKQRALSVFTNIVRRRWCFASARYAFIITRVWNINATTFLDVKMQKVHRCVGDFVSRGIKKNTEGAKRVNLPNSD